MEDFFFLLSTACFSRLNLISNGFNLSLIFFFWAVELAKFAFLLDFTILTIYFSKNLKNHMRLFWKQTEQISKGCVIVLTSAGTHVDQIFRIKNRQFVNKTLKQTLLLRTETGRNRFASKSRNLECLWKQSYICLSLNIETFSATFYATLALFLNIWIFFGM